MKSGNLAACLSLATLVGVFLASAAAEDKSAAAKGEKMAHGKIVRLDSALDAIVPKEAQMERLADGFEWSEGPVWSKSGKYVLFSDIPRNRIMKWQDGSGISVFIDKAGYTGAAKFTGGEPGTNGLTYDAAGNLVTCAHGDRVIQQFAGGKADGKRSVLAAKYEGKRLNSPNDLVYKSNGDLYFTDPPYGLPKQYDDPARELDWCGVYRLSKDGKLTLLTKEMTRPNGIAFSPDEKTLYVANSDPKIAIWKSFPVKDDGTLGEGKLVLDVTEHFGKMPGLPDGLKVDTKGNLYATGPGGVWILSPAGKPLGRLDTGEATANCGWGDDGSTLYITADMYLLRIKLTAKGLGF